MRATHHLLFYSVAACFLFFALLHVEIPGPTGGAIVQTYTNHEHESDTYAELLHDHVKEFFGIAGVYFPNDACGGIARSMYEEITFRPVDVTTGFESQGQERIATKNFVIDRLRRYGTIDMAHGASILEEFDADSMISLNAEAIVAVPKEDRANFFSMDLFGFIDGDFYVQKGRFSTPSMDCAFVRYNGDVACDCDAHPIRGIEVAGITAYVPDKDYYGEVLAELKQLQTS